MRFGKFLLAAALAGLLAACDTAEERAEKHYQAGLELLEKGDVDRALVEFRNVFKLNGLHKEARLVYASTERSRGNLGEAFGQYLRLVEQYPDNLEGLRALAEMAAESGNWTETEKYVTKALAVDPDDPATQAVGITLDYGRAAADDDGAGLQAAAARAAKAIETQPQNLLLYGILIDDRIRNQDFDAALAQIDRAIAVKPDDRKFYALRISTLAAKQDDVGVEVAIREMMQRFPEDRSIEQAMVRWYVSRKEMDKAESFMRERVDAQPDDQARALELVRFIAQFRSLDAALTEVEARIAAGVTSPVMRSARAGLRFDMGEREAGIAEMESLLTDAEPSEDTRRIKIGLARMQIVVGNPTAARALVEEVLAEDTTEVEALKLKAQWLIEDDEVGTAINTLRTALDQSPRDPAIMTLMAQAYERDGNRELMRDMLAMATEASGRAPEESVRYARFLMSRGDHLAAETVLIDALRLAPANVSLLAPLGQVYVAIEDWGRAEGVARELDRLDDPQAVTVSAGIRAASLAGQEKTDQAIKYLEELAASGTGGLATHVAIVRSHLAGGRKDQALAYVQKLVSEKPDDPALRFLEAFVNELTGDREAAEQTYRDLLASDPGQVEVWMALYRAVVSDPARFEEAGKIADEALAAVPGSPELLWARAGYLERAGDIDGAISIYEELYGQNSANLIVANNLASLLSNHRSDEASLSRAEMIARRLRGSNVAAFQDTFGWIQFLRGNNEEALVELEKAAAELSGDPSVQYHLGRVYAVLSRDGEALGQFERAIALTDDADQRPFAVSARAEAAKLRARGVVPFE